MKKQQMAQSKKITKPTTIRVAAYCRVSTRDQATENQEAALLAYIENHVPMELVDIYREKASAWEEGEQLELVNLIDAARVKRYDVLLVWSLDRLTRGGAETVLRLVHRLKTQGVKVISLKEPWTESPGDLDDLLYAITGWAAEMESRRRSERTLAGLERARAEGKHLGRPAGSKDAQKRRTAGYRLRHAKAAKERGK